MSYNLSVHTTDATLLKVGLYTSTADVMTKRTNILDRQATVDEILSNAQQALDESRQRSDAAVSKLSSEGKALVSVLDTVLAKALKKDEQPHPHTPTQSPSPTLSRFIKRIFPHS